MLNFKITSILFLIMLSSKSFADCKITKHTYEVISNNKTCHYTSFWREGHIGKMYHAERYNLWISPECKSFPKPLKGKKIKKELISEIIGSDCLFESVSPEK